MSFNLPVFSKPVVHVIDDRSFYDTDLYADYVDLRDTFRDKKHDTGRGRWSDLGAALGVTPPSDDVYAPIASVSAAMLTPAYTVVRRLAGGKVKRPPSAVTQLDGGQSPQIEKEMAEVIITPAPKKQVVSNNRNKRLNRKPFPRGLGAQNPNYPKKRYGGRQQNLVFFQSRSRTTGARKQRKRLNQDLVARRASNNSRVYSVGMAQTVKPKGNQVVFAPGRKPGNARIQAKIYIGTLYYTT